MFWRGVVGYLPANIVQGVVGFLTIIVFTRLLSAEDFGRYALAFSILTIAHVAVFSWLEASMARFWAAEKPGASMAAHFATLYRTAFLLSLAFVPVAGMALWLVPMEPAFTWAVGVGLAGVPIRCFAKLAQERFRAAGEVRKAATVDMAVVLGGFVVGVGFALAGAGAASPLAGLLIAPLFALPFILPSELRHARSGAVEHARLKRYANYGYPIAAGLALSVIMASTDRFLLAGYMDEAAVGAYHAGYSLANRTLDVLFIWLGAAGQPALVMALERGGTEQLKIAAREQASTFILIGLPAAVGVALVARPLAEFMIGEDLRAAVTTVTPLIAMSALLSGLTTYYFSQAFTLGRQTKMLLLTLLFPAVCNVALNVALIPVYGVLGAAMATTASFGIGLLASLAFGRRVIVMPIPWNAILRCGLASGVMALAVVWLPPIGGLPEVLMDAGVGVAVYSAVALALNAGNVRTLAKKALVMLRARMMPA